MGLTNINRKDKRSDLDRIRSGPIPIRTDSDKQGGNQDLLLLCENQYHKYHRVDPTLLLGPFKYSKFRPDMTSWVSLGWNLILISLCFESHI